MEPQSAARSVVTTPELALLLFSYLGPHDLVQCIRVCKEWMDHIEPILWRNVCLMRPSRIRPPDARLIKNSHYIRTVELVVNDFSTLHILAHDVSRSLKSNARTPKPSTFCTNLKRVKFERKYIDRADILRLCPHIASLLDHNRRLTHLTLTFPDVKINNPLIVAISNLIHLQHFSVNNQSVLEPRTMALLLQTCLPLPKLKELWINLTVDWNSRSTNIIEVPSLKTIIKEAAIARFSQTPTPSKIKSLQLPVRSERSENPLALPLLQSDVLDLESCMVFTFTEDLPLRDIERIVRQYCPNLKHLTCPSSYDLIDGMYVHAFILGCSRLQSFASNYFCDRTYNDDDEYESQRMISTLVSHHCNTLEDFELAHCNHVYSSDLQAVLSRCNHLKRFYFTVHHVDGNSGFLSEDVLKGGWVCTELRELRMSMGRHSSTHAIHFYRQIGRLEKLEELALDVARADTEAGDYAWDLTLSKGWLGEMAGLKNLRSLSLAAEFWSKIGQAEVEFMLKHWPLLREIHIVCKDISRVQTFAVCEFLCNKRPHLRSSAEERSYPKTMMQMINTAPSVKSYSLF